MGKRHLAYTIILIAVVVLGTVTGTLFTPVAEAQSQQDLASCSTGAGYRRIGACTRVINSGGLKHDKLGTAYYNRGLGFSQERSYFEAITDFDTALNLNGKDVDALIARGNAWVRVGQNENAIHDFTQAISIQPYYALAYANRGVAYEFIARIDLAIADYKKALSLGHSESYQTLQKLGATTPNIEQTGEPPDSMVCAIDDSCINLCSRTCGNRSVRLCTRANGCSGACIVWCR